ncbi:hypothetical protein ACWDXT_20975 [Streptomyces sp. NPDC003236]|uniref:hypothetical protein n=1 Tax=Streptomyces sp. NPDC093248 TaxID=3155072 RepID=UPI00343EFBB1
MRTTIRRGLATLLGVAALATAQAGVASANDLDKSTESFPEGSRVTWHADGEHLLVKDTVADGHSAVAIFRWWDQSEDRYHTFTYFNRDGEGTTRDVNMDLYEHTTVNFRACVGDWKGSLENSSDTIRNCSSWEVSMA